MSIFMIIFVLFILLYLYVSVVISRKGTSKGEFYTMDGKANEWLVAGTYTATWISAVGMIGIAGMSYSTGPLSGIWDWGAYIGFIISAFFLGNKLRKFGQVTLGDFLGDRYDSDTIRVIAAAGTILGLGAYFISGIIGSAVITEMMFGLPFNVMVIIMVAVFILIAVVGGAKSVTVTDTIMLSIICICLGYIFSPLLLKHVGLYRFADFAAANPLFFTAGGGKYAWGTIIGWQFLWGLGNAANPSALTRSLLAKDSRTWVKAMIIATMLTMSVVWLSHMASAGVHLINPDLAGNQALTWAAMNVVNPVIGALAIAGLFGACLSTASTQVLSLSFSVTRDIYEKIINKNASEKTLLKMARIWILVFGVLGAALAMSHSSILTAFGNFGSSIFAAGFFFPLFFGMNWRRFSKKAAVWSLTVGLVIDTLFYIVIPLSKGLPMQDASWLPWGIHPTLWAIAASLIVAVIAGFIFDANEKEKAVYDLCNEPIHESEVKTSLSSLKKYVYALAVYAFVQTAVVLWFAAKIG